MKPVLGNTPFLRHVGLHYTVKVFFFDIVITIFVIIFILLKL